MNGDNNLKLRYTDFLEETKKINQSILNDERKKAKKEGRLENQRDIVLNMYDKGWDLKLISEGTQLSIKEIENIIDINNIKK